MTRLEAGSVVKERRLNSIRSAEVAIPDSEALVHLQFRRFAGCPICDLHLHSFAARHRELAAASVREVIVFHSSKDELLKFCAGLPFEVIADPEKRLYAQFDVQSELRALFHPGVWVRILQGVIRSFGQVLRKQMPMPSLNPGGGRFGLPADFLIAPSGMILACKYGSHAYDQWSLDEVLDLARLARSETARSALV
ncbi:peroxiredoxin-like family protein [Occallatibacter riparius]|uniref:AhpC/TSA family protein n=1 Tax=Occallatibacter riparius TaxID=1002689 RepID=A0A9J7BUV0_9BACT|nr:peroxiredoxin-like family protein [Occallatibacter riparius]UWZ85538.1 AhpC/TSA family protein [Occallatibacter riparius]